MKKQNAYIINLEQGTLKLRKSDPIVFMLLTEWIASINSFNIDGGSHDHINFCFLDRISKVSKNIFIHLQFFNTHNLPVGVDLKSLVNYINNNS